MKIHAQLLLMACSVWFILSGCNSVKEEEYYVNRTTGEKVRVVFVGSEKEMVARYGPSLKYHTAPEGTDYVMFEPGPLASDAANNAARILSEKEFLGNYGWVEKPLSPIK